MYGAMSMILGKVKVVFTWLARWGTLLHAHTHTQLRRGD